MDPNKALQDLREAIARHAALCEGGAAGSSDEVRALEDALDAARALDGWLSRGGFLPDAWRAGR